MWPTNRVDPAVQRLAPGLICTAPRQGDSWGGALASPRALRPMTGATTAAPCPRYADLDCVDYWVSAGILCRTRGGVGAKCASSIHRTYSRIWSAMMRLPPWATYLG